MKTNKHLKADKQFSQNFITNSDMIKRIVDYANIQPQSRVLEIGPGTGNLTKHITQKTKHLTLVEIDSRFESNLRKIVRTNGDIIWDNFLNIDCPEFDIAISNLPYREALPITFKLLDSNFKTCILIYQDSMAQRIAARPGNAKYGRISINIQRIAAIQLLDIIDPTDFSPRPSVKSRILRLTKRKSPEFTINDQEYFDSMLEFLLFYKEWKLKEVLDLYSIKLNTLLLDTHINLISGYEFNELAKSFKQFDIFLPQPTEIQKRKREKLLKQRIKLD